ncbi:MAG: methionine--tRNA ligase, partial [Alphaproteobacteria bacterium]
NDDLANDFGNLVQRVLSMINRNCDARVPEPGVLDAADQALLDGAHGLADELRGHFAVQAFHSALIRLWEVIGAANRYVVEQAPWTLRKTDPARMRTVLYVLAEAIRHLAILAQPVTPLGAGQILDQLAVGEGARDIATLGPKGALAPGTPLPKPEGVFPRFVEAAQATP